MTLKHEKKHTITEDLPKRIQHPSTLLGNVAHCRVNEMVKRLLQTSTVVALPCMNVLRREI